MTDTQVVPNVAINNPEEFRSFVAELNKGRDERDEIKVGDRGRLPMREVSRAIVRLQQSGALTFTDTIYFPITDWALGETVSPHKSKSGFSYVITYSVKGVDGTHTLTLTDDVVNEYLPNVKGKVGGAYATMLVALHLNTEDENAPLSRLTNYSVKNVTRIATPPESEVKKTEDAPKGDDTPETDTDADKATETPEDVKAPEVPEPAKAEVVADEVTPDVPALVPAEAAPKPARARKSTSRKPVAKAAAK